MSFKPKQLSAIRTLIGQTDGRAVREGLELLQSLNDPVLWEMLAEGVAISQEGRVEVPIGSLFNRRVRKPFRMEVALWALRGSGRLAGVQKLDLSGCQSLTNVDGLAGLTELEALDLSSCLALIDVDGVKGLKSLQVLNLSAPIPRVTIPTF